MNRSKLKVFAILAIAVLSCINAYAQKGGTSFSSFIEDFCTGYQKLKIPELEYDYKTYFKAIPDTANLNAQAVFFRKMKRELSAWHYKSLKERDKLHYDQLVYECANNLQRIALEKEWVKQGRIIPQDGLKNLADNRKWYNLFSKRFTSVDMGPEDIYNMGLAITKDAQIHIAVIRDRLDFADSASFYQYLKKDTFILTDKNEILACYSKIDSIVRRNLDSFITSRPIPPVYVMEWPDADKFTPPGMYMNKEENTYGKDVFEFNFFGGKHNVRAMEWLYLHEAIPGHHLQSTEWRQESKDDSLLQHLFSYPGNFEGWACYVESWGKNLGLYQNPYCELGKWEWNLVRSARVVLDVGIHYYGWNHDKAMAYWKANITGQDEIAEREITRITNWPGQVLSYKVGESKIMELHEKYKAKEGKKYDARKFHTLYVTLGMVPLEIVEKYIVAGVGGMLN